MCVVVMHLSFAILVILILANIHEQVDGNGDVISTSDSGYSFSDSPDSDMINELCLYVLLKFFFFFFFCLRRRRFFFVFFRS